MELAHWAIVVGLAMTPALILGQSVAVGAGIEFGFDPWILVPVVAAAGYAEGMIVAWLGGASTRIGFVQRWCERMRKPRTVAFARKWGVWGGMTIGVAFVGQEPILIALRWLGVELRRLWLATAVSNAVFAVIYYGIVKLGLSLLS
jgi:hypothetical protein